VRPCVRCTTRLASRDGHELRPSGFYIVVVPRLDLDRLRRLTNICVTGWPQTEREGLAVRRILR
jgi:hypothetical protein